jgi:hypothetical protein
MPVPGWLAAVKILFDRLDVPWEVWVPIAWEESSLNPNASNTVPPDDSWGLFALNRHGGQGHGRTPEALKNPVTNATIASGPIQNAVKKCGKNDIICIAINSGHPTETGTLPPGNPLPQRIARTHNYVKGKSFDDAVTGLLNGAELPPPDQGGGDIGSQIGGLIRGWGTDFVRGVGDAIKDKWNSAQEADKDIKIHFWSNVAGYTVGAGLVGFGAFSLVLKSPPARLAADVASNVGPAPVRIGGAVARVAQGRSSAGAGTVKIRAIRQ